MKFRWTIKELKESSDDKIIRGILAERMSELNPYSPLREKLQSLYNKYDEKFKTEKIVPITPAILITIEGGNLQNVVSSFGDVEILVVDFDNMEVGDKPVYVREPDNVLKNGKFHELYTNASDSQEMEVREVLKDLGY